MKPCPRSVWLAAILTVGWSAAVASGFVLLLRYKSAAGKQLEARSEWPAESRIEPVTGCRNLVLAVDPHCPSSRASVAELERALVGTSGVQVHVLVYRQSPVFLLVNLFDGLRVQVHVLVYRQSPADDSWLDTDMVQEVKKISGSRIHADDLGLEAERFGAVTSGHMVLYDPQGKLLFRGGITASRGHEGDSERKRMLRQPLLGEPGPSYVAPVYGCPLHAPDPSRETP
jgi:hypothetical protein